MLSQGDLRAKVAEGKQGKDPKIKLAQDPFLDFSIDELIWVNCLDHTELLIIDERWRGSVYRLDVMLCHDCLDLILEWL